ncbi:MAG: Na+/H+ antiporter subunit E [bacterium]|nr:Na+/H+ antiporter subunit E [bacterium]
MNLFVLNIFIAAVWLLLADKPDAPTFVIGFIIGFVMIWIFKSVFQNVHYLKKRFFKDPDYVKKTVRFLYYVIYFLKEFIVANVKIAWAVLTMPNRKIDPNIITLDVTDLTTFEIIMLSQCITLTPGTTTVMVSDDQNTLYVHAFDAKDPDKARQEIENGLKKEILRFTR